MVRVWRSVVDCHVAPATLFLFSFQGKKFYDRSCVVLQAAAKVETRWVDYFGGRVVDLSLECQTFTQSSPALG
jgi:hypothetical protein